MSGTHFTYAFQPLGKWLSVGLRTKWLWVRVQLQSLKIFHMTKLKNRAPGFGKASGYTNSRICSLRPILLDL